MRTSILIGFVAVATIGCGSDSGGHKPDAAWNTPPPRVISGGGIGDGPVDGVVNLYVIDDATRQPIAGAMASVGDVSGTTDSTGLFVAQGVFGPQQVAIAATGYRSELWLGANGANMTADLKAATDNAPAQATLAGQITGFSAITVPTGHHKAAIVTYSADDRASDAANNLSTPGFANICDVALANGGCAFAVVTRTGHVALIAAILDHDLNGTPTNPADDTYTVIGWATRTGVSVTGGVDMTGEDLTIVPANQLTNVTASLGNPPSALTNVAAIAGIELGTDGTLNLAKPLTNASPNVLAPALAAFPSATYRLTAFANTGATGTTAQPSAAVLGRGQTGASLAAPPWLTPPGGVSLTRTGGSWNVVSGAVAQGATYDVDATHHLLSVTAFDGSMSFTIPSLVALPTAGTIQAAATALAGTIDLTNFAIDDAATKVTGFSSSPVTIN